MKTGSRAGVVWVQATGGILSSLRTVRLLNNYLMVFGSRPHRVTRLDVTLDLPFDTPPILTQLYESAKKGDLHLTRKTVDRRNVTLFIEPSLYGGDDTGTIYLGAKTAEVRLKVYDKRQEVLKHTGNDLGHVQTRYECTVTNKMGPSLRDVAEPAPIFYHYMSPDILTKPIAVGAWSSYEGGYDLPKRSALPYQTLKRRIESSPELARLVKIANECGPSGLDILIFQIRKLAGSETPTLAVVATG